MLFYVILLLLCFRKIYYKLVIFFHEIFFFFFTFRDVPKCSVFLVLSKPQNQRSKAEPLLAIPLNNFTVKNFELSILFPDPLSILYKDYK